MGEAIALREPEDEAVAVEVLAEVVGVADIFLLALFDEGADVASDGHLIDTIEVVAALVVFEADGVAVGAPFRAGEVILVGDELRGGSDGASGGYLKDVRSLLGEFVAGLGIFLLVEDGLELVGGGGLDVINVAFLDGTDALDSHIAAVGTPVDIAAKVVADGAFGAEGASLGAVGPGDIDVVVADEGYEGGVGRGDGVGIALVVGFHPVPFLTALAGIGDEAGALLIAAATITSRTQPSLRI